MGSLVNVISLNDAARAEDFRPLPSSVVSSAFAAVSAADVFLLM